MMRVVLDPVRVFGMSAGAADVSVDGHIRPDGANAAKILVKPKPAA